MMWQSNKVHGLCSGGGYASILAIFRSNYIGSCISTKIINRYLCMSNWIVTYNCCSLGMAEYEPAMEILPRPPWAELWDSSGSCPWTFLNQHVSKLGESSSTEVFQPFPFKYACNSLTATLCTLHIHAFLKVKGAIQNVWIHTLWLATDSAIETVHMTWHTFMHECIHI